MTRTAAAMGMSKTTFKNANGLTAQGHLSTAHDMTMLGRRLFYDFPQYYGIFSRRSADAGIAQVASTNRRFLDSLRGRGRDQDRLYRARRLQPGRLGRAWQQAHHRHRLWRQVHRQRAMPAWPNLLDIGFGKAPNRATVAPPPAIAYNGDAMSTQQEDVIAEAIAVECRSDRSGCGQDHSA